MTYADVTEFLFSQLAMYQRVGSSAYKPGLGNAIALDDYFGKPHLKFKSIHIAGTNGKGSTSHMLASVLQEAGFKVGLYTSPHLKDFRERIRINGQSIDEQSVIDFVQNHRNFFSQIKPSFFELTVSMAFDYFAKQDVDFAIVEVGLGGRLDSTNIINPILSVITNISLDHTGFLGNTLDKIAREKAGIMKAGIPVVIGKKQVETTAVFLDCAANLSSPLVWAEEFFQIHYGMKDLEQRQVFNVFAGAEKCYEGLKLDLLGAYQRENVVTALASIEQLRKLDVNIEGVHVYRGLANVVKNTGLQGRWQIVGSNPLVICDTGHNEGGVQEVVLQLKTIAHKQLHIVWGMVSDKDVSTILSLLPTHAIYYFTKPSIDRAMESDALFDAAQQWNLHGCTYASVEQAVAEAIKAADKQDVIFVGGSTFVVADYLTTVGN